MSRTRPDLRSLMSRVAGALARNFGETTRSARETDGRWMGFRWGRAFSCEIET
jgi:hypothetical protein